MVEAQLIETALLNIVNYQTLIATKVARIKGVIGDEVALEFGTRRAHEMDAAMWERGDLNRRLQRNKQCKSWKAL